MLFSPSVMSNSLHPQASLSFTISQSLLKLMSTERVMPFNHLVLCLPLVLLPSIFPSIRVFSEESALCSPLNVKPHKFQRHEEQVYGSACVTVERELGHVVIGGCPQGGNV